MASSTVEYTSRILEGQNTFSTFPPSQLYFQSGNNELAKPRTDTLVSNHAAHVIEVVVLTILCGIISAFGLVANVINVLVFFRQGALSSSSNVSLLALAFTDIGALIPVLCNSVNYALFNTGVKNIFRTPFDFMGATVMWPHIMCVQVASLITAYIAFERCLCVVIPLKVKSLFSAKRSLLVTASIASIVVISYVPMFATQRILKIFDSSTNSTKLISRPIPIHFQIREATDMAHAYILRPLALFVVFMSTQITVCRIKLSSSWRKSVATTSSSTTPTTKNANADNNHEKTSIETSGPKTSKETRLIKMITMISTIFMICTTPDILTAIITSTVLQLVRRDNIFRLFITTQLFSESINSSINIFVYYRMSTTYRQAFQSLIGKH